MTTHETPDFLAGVIEGFYGQPWTHEQRLELLSWMGDWGLDTYLYAPKDDLHQRVAWREVYVVPEAEKFGKLVYAARQSHVHFVYALSPGLDIRYSETAELKRVKERFAQMISLSCECFALLFDDVPGDLNAKDAEQYGSLASAQCQIANATFKWLRERRPNARLLFCPTAYCGRMADQKIGGAGYLDKIGLELLPEISVLWTGPDIISREITLSHVVEMQTRLRRKPVIWDNLHANDYDGRRFFCGPYAGRNPELRSAIGGLLSNPNNEFPLNYVPLRTLAEFLKCAETWNPRKAYLAAMQEWVPKFAIFGLPISLEELILLGDCYYLPHEEGPEAEALYEETRDLLGTDPAAWGGSRLTFHRRAGRLRKFCGRLNNLHNRLLFYALSRYIWELREELDLLEHYVEFKSLEEHRGASFRSDFHLPGTYRGGLVPRLQGLLAQQPDGTFKSAFPHNVVQAKTEHKLAVSSAP